jgi:hypothetical protein
MTATRSERRTCLDFAQADDGQKEPHQSCQCDSGSPGVSNHGVKFGGCRGEFKIGDKIEVLYRHKHAQARVAWITAPEGSSEKQIGVEFLELEKQVWGVEFPEQADEYEEKD